MRKLVMTGLTVPTVLLAALALCGPALAADGQDLNDQTLNARKASGESARPADRTAPADDSTVVLASEVTTLDNRAGRTNDTTAARADRRGRQAPRRTDAGAVIDEEAYWWWSKKGKGDDENDDEDNDENQSEVTP